jgi:hypothetical protein
MNNYLSDQLLDQSLASEAKRIRDKANSTSSQTFRYTIDISEEVMDARDELAKNAKRYLKHHVTKADIIRNLILLAEEQETVQKILFESLRQ